MTQHQAPEVTSELRECPLCNRQPKRNGRGVVGGVICRHAGHLVQVYGASQADADKNWNTRATQPLSLTVDDDLAQTVAAWRDHFAPDGKRIRLDPANKESLHAVLGRVVAALGGQSANCSGDIDRSGLAQEVES